MISLSGFSAVIVNRSKPELTAWTRKYFTEASVSWFLEDAEISGIKESKFNSSPTHKNSQLLDESTMIIPVVRNDSINMV